MTETVPYNDKTAGLGALAAAQLELGKPYVFGGNFPPLGVSDGTDCSGLFQWAYAKVGIPLPRTTFQQYLIKPVSGAYLPGDGLFFEGSDPGAQGEPGHVGMYVGVGLITANQHGWSQSATGKPIMLNAPYTGDPGGIRFDYVAAAGSVVDHTRPALLLPDPPPAPSLPHPSLAPPSVAQLAQCRLVGIANVTQAQEAMRNGYTLWYYAIDGHFHPQVNGQPQRVTLYANVNFTKKPKSVVGHSA